MTQRTIEQHLSNLLKRFDKNMYINYMQKAEVLKTKIQDLDLDEKTEIIKSPDDVGTVSLKISFDLPVYIVLSHPICRLKTQKRYPIGAHSYIANLGLVPLYFATANVMTVMKMWGRRTDRFFSPVNEPIPEDSIACWEISKVDKDIEYSTMNFLSGEDSTENLVSEDILDLFERYLKFAYWSFPKRGFTFSTHILYKQEEITSVIKVAKSLYIIERIGERRKLRIEDKTIDCVWCRIRGLSKNDGSYALVPFDVLIDEELAERLSKDGHGFINGMVTELREDGSREEFMISVQDYGESNTDLFQALIGMVSISKYTDNDSVCFVGRKDEIKKEVNEIVDKIHLKIDLKTSIGDVVLSSFDSLLDLLFPLFIAEGQDIYYVHPLVISFITKYGITMEDIKNDRKILTSLLQLMNRCSRERNFTSLYISDETDYLCSKISNKNVSKERILRDVVKISKLIRVLKLVQKCFDID